MSARTLLFSPVSPETEFILTMILIVIYGILCLLALLWVCRMFYYKHNIFSFQGAFLSLCFLWTAFRIAFFADPRAQWPLAPILVVYWLPTNIQFATFSLLVVFYARVVYTTDWEEYYKRRVVGIHITANLIVLLGFCVWTILALRYNDIGDDDALNVLLTLRQYISFGFFCLLALALAFFFVKLINMGTTNSAVLFAITSQPKASKPRVVVVTLVVLLMFVSRACFDLLVALDIFSLQLDGGVGGHARLVTVEVLCFYLMWEVVPTLAVLVFFRRVPKTRLGLFATREQDDVVSRRFQAQLYLPEGNRRQTTINNPHRYDTDDESNMSMSLNKATLGRSPWSIWGTPQADSPFLGEARSHTQYGTNQSIGDRYSDGHS